MVMKEAVRLFDSIDGEEVLVDLCDEGDLFGVRAIFGTSAYLLSAQVVEESLLLAIPSESVEQLSQEREKAEKLLKMYIAQEVAIHFISNIFTELNDALIVKAIEFSVAGMKKEGMEMPDIEFCWLSLGSEGRKEQLLRTDQDNAILFRDPHDEASRQAAQQAFLELGKRVSAILVACGFEPCPAKIMASNPDWCQPLSGWMNYFRKWIGTPEPKALMNSTIFFDFRPVYGSTALALEMKREINAEIERGRGFLQFFAKNALQNPPPLGFFRNFLVEKSREHAHEFDIKARAMMPLSDAARVLACEFGVTEFLGTVERFRRIGQLLPSFQELSEEAAQAYEFLMRLRTERGLAENSSGRYIDPEHLNKMQRQELRNLFTTIGQVQSMLNLRYQLDYIRD